MFIYVWTWTSLQPDVSIVCLRIRASLTSVILQYSIVDIAVSCTCFIFALSPDCRQWQGAFQLYLHPNGGRYHFLGISIRYYYRCTGKSTRKFQITVYLQCHSDMADISPQKTINIFNIFEVQLQVHLVIPNHHFAYTLHSLKMFISQMICCAVGISLIMTSAKRMIN